jgi:hypothetical protein
LKPTSERKAGILLLKLKPIDFETLRKIVALVLL